MNREELIKLLLEQDLKQFRFSIWATYNEEGNLKYTYCLAGEKPAGYEIRLFDIGGNPDYEYNYECLEFCILR